MSHPLAPILAQHSAVIGLFLLAVLLTAFATERLPPVVIALVAGVLMMVLGFLPPSELLQVFSNTAPVTIGAMFVLSGALLRTGVLEEISGWVLRRSMRRPRLAMAEIGAGAFAASAVMNNTPVVIVMIPIIKRLGRVIGTSATRLLIPLSYVTILGGTLTLIGTSTNLLVNGVAQEQGLPGFGMFEITGVGLITAVAGIGFLGLVGPWLLPDREEPGAGEHGESDNYLSHLVLLADSRLVGQVLEETGLSRRQGVQVIAIRRGQTTLRKQLGEVELQAGDQLVVSASPAELASLAEEQDFRVGLTGIGGGIVTAGPERAEDARLVEAVVSPSHPVIGRRLADIPMLSRLRVRVLGLSRPRHLPGPDLANARVRAADRLLIAAGEDAAIALASNIGLAQVAEAPARAFKRQKAPIAAAVLALVVLGSALLNLPIEALALVGVAVVLITRCIEPEEAWSTIDGNTLVLIFGMLAFGTGLQAAGTVQLIVDFIRPALTHASPLVLLFAIYALTSALTETVTNNAVAVIMTPLVIGLSEAMGTDPRPLIVAIMFGASASFATPIGYQTNTLVYGAANYRFTDFIKVGLPMNIVVGIAACFAINWLF
ncbi:SLC13 family permease [Novosphingobium sp. M1R2S20]|uniref:SLC13 family permease n=1 Tax=Novosphingobium rhizovicinum TaxID=3228928 RepID=A0ABV3R8I2_9SPHN